MAELYEKCECIGKGSFGEVYKGREIATGKIVALKLVDLEKADDEIDIIQREIKVMSQIANPHVVQYYTSLMRGSTLWIVMEFMSGGSLKELLDTVGPFPEDAIAAVLKALLKGLEYIHRERKLHRDIKAANILISEHGDVKLADFGVAGQMTMTVRQRNTFVGSPFWMAPEVIQESLYDEKADIWSAGITALELANGLPPYATEHPYRALFLIPKNDPPRLEGSNFSKTFKEFVALCLRKNPNERPSAEHLLSHSFIKKARATALKELLRQREVSCEDIDSAAEITEPTSNSHNGTVRSMHETADGNANTMAAPAKWEFDFDLGEELDRKVKSLDLGTVVGHPGESLEVINLSDEAMKSQSMRATSTASVVSGVDTWDGTIRKHPDGNVNEHEECNDSPSDSEVLTKVILPVISQMRADVDAHGDHNDALIGSLGSLEVVFLECESAKRGCSAALVEALFKEALKCKSGVVRDMMLRCLQNKDHTWEGG